MGVLEFEEQAAAGYEYPRVLDEMRAAGYDGTELGDWGFMPTDPDLLRIVLTERSLSLVGAFVPVRLADDSARAAGERAAIRTAMLLKDAGFPRAFVVLADDIAASPERTAIAGRVGADHQLSEDGRATFASNAEGDRARGARGDRSAHGISSSLRLMHRNTGGDLGPDAPHGSRRSWPLS